MRTKTLLLAAVLGVAVVATSLAQTVYSVNVVGYVNVTVPGNSLAIIANPLKSANDTLGSVLTVANGVPYGTQIYKFTGTGYQDATYDDIENAWMNGAVNMNSTPFAAGEGFFIRNTAGTPFTITFVGEVLQATAGPLTVTSAPGLTLKASLVPQQGRISTDLEFPRIDGTQVYLYNGAGYNDFIYDELDAAWKDGTGVANEPVIPIGRGFWIRNNGAANIVWSRNFTVN